ncbi:hypothetical protein CKJ54_22140 [Mycobacterium marseillense]|uniref:Uncharacterized protein n=1 Tax=Mycobacterium marseillense TaxID=701042 RepID=A0AAC9YMQ9_9MYCO|nr:hypothetical protein CKJ54_22140 [Mycobacterium marseillense]
MKKPGLRNGRRGASAAAAHRREDPINARPEHHSISSAVKCPQAWLPRAFGSKGRERCPHRQLPPERVALPRHSPTIRVSNGR